MSTIHSPENRRDEIAIAFEDLCQQIGEKTLVLDKTENRHIPSTEVLFKSVKSRLKDISVASKLFFAPTPEYREREWIKRWIRTCPEDDIRETLDVFLAAVVDHANEKLDEVDISDVLNIIKKSSDNLYSLIIEYPHEIELYDDEGKITMRLKGTLSIKDSNQHKTSNGKAVENADHVFRKDGDMWAVTYNGKTKLINDQLGMKYIAYLLKYQGQDIEVSKLFEATRGDYIPTSSTRYAEMDAEQLDKLGLRNKSLSSGVKIMDDTYKANVDEKLKELGEELKEAMDNEDEARIHDLSNEIQEILEIVGKSKGLGGRDRKVGDDFEKQRKAVSKAIHRVLDKMEEVHPDLWKHLEKNLDIGDYLCYKPEIPISWTLE